MKKITVNEFIKVAEKFHESSFAKKKMDEGVDGFIQIDIKINNNMHRINLVYYNNPYHIEIDCYMYCVHNNDRDYLWTFHNTLMPSNDFIDDEVTNHFSGEYYRDLRGEMNELYSLLYDKMVNECNK